MRVFPTRLTTRRAVACFLLLVGICMVPMAAYSQSRSSLQRRARETRSNIQDARQNLATKQRKARAARNELVDCQEQLAAAESRLRRARRQLAATARELDRTKLELERTKKRLASHQAAMQKRLIAMFRSDEPSYTEVVLHATTFEDFANRLQFMRLVAHGDESILVQIVTDKLAVETQEKALEQRQKEQEALKARVARERATVAAKTVEAASLAQRAQSDAAEAARQLDAMEDELHSVEAMLKRLAERQRATVRPGSGGSASYGSWSGSLARPVPGYISSGYGWRIHPITHTRRFHDGIDLACGGGTPVHSAASGTILDTGWRGPYGLTVLIDHGGGVSTMYCHLERGSIQVSPGQHVGRGQTVARVDSTGWSTGDHLHWMVFRNGSHVNPLSM